MAVGSWQIQIQKRSQMLASDYVNIGQALMRFSGNWNLESVGKKSEKCGPKLALSRGLRSSMVQRLPGLLPNRVQGENNEPCSYREDCACRQ